MPQTKVQAARHDQEEASEDSKNNQQQIVGLSKENPEGEELFLGRWCDKQVPNIPAYNGVLEIAVSESGAVELRRYYGDKSSGTSSLTQSDNGTYWVDGSSSGDSFRIVQSSGDLQLLDNEGLIRVASRISDSPQSRECGF
jgi:hypothetical protein